MKNKRTSADGAIKQKHTKGISPKKNSFSPESSSLLWQNPEIWGILGNPPQETSASTLTAPGISVL